MAGGTQVRVYDYNALTQEWPTGLLPDGRDESNCVTSPAFSGRDVVAFGDAVLVSDYILLYISKAIFKGKIKGKIKLCALIAYPQQT